MLIDYILQEENFLTLKRERQKGTFPKSLLLCGKDKLYLYEFARACALLLVDNNLDMKSEAVQKVLLGANPDVKTYPQKDKLLVSDSEEIVDESFIKPIFSQNKIFIVREIENSMDSAQNKLLKVVEEPSNNVYLILTTTNTELVLPTIRSRCNKLELGKLPDSVIEKELRLKGDLSTILALADGNLGKAQELAKTHTLDALCQDAVGVFTNMKTSKQVLSQAKSLSSSKNYSLIFEIFSQIVEDLINIKCKREVRLSTYKSQLCSAQEDYTIRALCEISSLLNKANKELMYNVNPLVALENLLLNILEVKYLCK